MYLMLMSGIWGYVAGLGVALATGHFVSRYASPSVPPRAGRGLSSLLAMWRGVPRWALLVSTGMALLAVYAGWWGMDLRYLAAAVIVTSLLATVALVDFQTRRIPDALCLALVGWAVIQMLWLGQPAPQAMGLGLAVGGGAFMLLALARRGAMGAGDVKLAAAVGALLGYPLILQALCWGILAGGVGALVLLLTRRAGRKDYMAYGPYIALGAWLVWIVSIGLRLGGAP